MDNYFSINSEADDCVLIYSLQNPSDYDNWMWGQRFKAPIKEPVEAIIIPDNDSGVLLPLYIAPELMHKNLYKIIIDAGVDNIDVYEAVIKTEQGNIISNDYVAYNIFGVLKAGDLTKTQFATENSSRMIDASIEKLVIDEKSTCGFLLFRLAQSLKTVIVHTKVKEAIEKSGIPNIVFYGSNDFIF